MVRLIVHFKIDSIDGILFGFVLGTEYEIKHEVVKGSDLGSLIG